MGKKILKTFAAFLLVCSLLVVPAFAESATVTGSVVNIRSGPGTDYYVVATVKKGEAVTVTDRSNPTWYAVNYNGTPGFVSSAYLSLSGSGTAAVPAAQQSSVPTGSGKNYINGMYVRFRSGPGSSYSVVGEYNTGTEISVVTTVGDWVAGYIDGKPGYVHKQYVSSGSYTQPASVIPSAAPAQTVGSSQGGITVVSPSSGQGAWTLPQPGGSIPVSGGQQPAAQSSGGITVLPQPMYPTVSSAPVSVITPAPIPTPTSAPAAVQAVAPVSASGTKGYIVGTYVRFRTGPGSTYSIIGTYNTGKELIAYANVGNGWLFCSIDGKEGYVSGNYVFITSEKSGTTAAVPSGASSSAGGSSGITAVAAPTVTQPQAQAVQTVNKKGYIVGNNVRFRSSPSMTSQIIAELFYGNECVIIGYSGEWAQVMYNEKPGYVFRDYVKEGSYGSFDISPAAAAAKSGATGQDIVNFAMQFLGAKYCWGGTSPETGFDCSGFVSYVYSQFGFTLNRVAADQAKNGVHVDPSNLQPGDILCFYSGSSYIGHSGIYIGSNKFIHSSNSTTGVIISELSGLYSSRGFEARRIV